mgnify:CR=1 FL=1
MNIFKKLFDHEHRELKKFESLAKQVLDLDEEYTNMSDKELKAKTDEFKERLANGETLEDIKIEAFATAREAAYRVIGEKPYFVQVVGGFAIHYGNIAEMKTGEGKTLTETMPAYLNALTGEGVHIITVNEYLAERDANWMGEIYRFLGLTVGVNYRESSHTEKQEAYNCDILYSTNNEIGFDYLRDNMVVRADERVARPLNFCIIDEVDSVLIDEARTPLIISGGFMQSANLYIQTDRFAKTLKENKGYIYDEQTKATVLDEYGIEKAEKTFNVKNLYDIENTNLVHFINQSLKANFAMHKDVDYVVKDDAIVIVDPFTGRLMEGRTYSDGLHQAIEAKEGVTINEETKTLATITFQNLFRMYKKLSGMTGTAKTEEEEFRDIYNMYVICIPTNKPVIREDCKDLLFATKEGKYKAIVNEIIDRHKKGQPVLVGTIAVETSELISERLKKKGVPHEVLNAKNHAREAEIISHAGEKGAITIATNMAGRGTDIKLGEGVKELGGLYVIGTERHESRRIDNQLRGRSGRQGDPGTSQFFVSFEDDLMRRFGTEKVKGMLIALGLPEDEAIRSRTFTKSVESAQKKVEGNNYDMRKSLLDYDNVMNQQREIIYRRRNELIDSEDTQKLIYEVFENRVADLIDAHIAPEGYLTEHDIEDILEVVNNNLLRFNKIEDKDIEGKEPNDVIDFIVDKVKNDYEKKLENIPESVIHEFEKAISLRVIDAAWVEHISTMEQLREGIGLRGYAQTNPLQAYTEEGFNIFDQMQQAIDARIATFLLKAEVNANVERKQTIGEQSQIKENEGKQKPIKKTKIGRNDPCPCGSGKKYKQCHGK